MPNTSSAKKALRNSLKKKAFNLVSKSKIKNALRDFRKVIVTSPSEYQVTLSKAFSALDKAVKTNFIPKGRADRKKSRLAAMASKANLVETKVIENTETVAAETEKTPIKKTTVTKPTAKKAPVKAKSTVKKAK